MNKTPIITFVIVILFSLNSFAQSIQMNVIGTAGEQYTSSDHSVSWSLGEVVVETVSSDNVVLTQGFHQPNYLITGIENNLTEINVKLFPNPVEDKLQLELDMSKNDLLEYQIIDLNGKMIQNGQIKENCNKIDMSSFAKGFYIFILKDVKDRRILKSYKVEKLK